MPLPDPEHAALEALPAAAASMGPTSVDSPDREPHPEIVDDGPGLSRAPKKFRGTLEQTLAQGKQRQALLSARDQGYLEQRRRYLDRSRWGCALFAAWMCNPSLDSAPWTMRLTFALVAFALAHWNAQASQSLVGGLLRLGLPLALLQTVAATTGWYNAWLPMIHLHNLLWASIGSLAGLSASLWEARATSNYATAIVAHETHSTEGTTSPADDWVVASGHHAPRHSQSGVNERHN